MTEISDSDACARSESGELKAALMIPHSYESGVTAVSQPVLQRLCACGGALKGKAKRCKPCNTQYMRDHRAKGERAQVDIVIVEALDTETGKAVFFVGSIPNDAAQADGWEPKSLGRYKSLKAARARQKVLDAALELLDKEPLRW